MNNSARGLSRLSGSSARINVEGFEAIEKEPVTIDRLTHPVTHWMAKSVTD
jgi:hypothetical protein